MSGHKIIEGLEDAMRGDFSRVTIAGHVWIRDGVDKAAAWDAVASARSHERERCAKIAARWKSSLKPGTEARLLGHQEASRNIAKAIREHKRSPQETASD